MHTKRLITVVALSLVFVIGLLDSLPTALAGPGDNLFVIPQPSGLLQTCAQSDPCRLQIAVNKAADGDTIYLAAGTYTSTAEAVATVTKSITLYGGWNGAASGVIVRDPYHFQSILNGQGVRRGVYINGDITPTLDGLYVTNGSSAFGGGIYAEAAHPIINNCRIYSNTAGNSSGGGIYILNGSLARLTGNQVYSNAASNCGGIDLLDSPTVTLSSNQVYSNFAQYSGGGLCLQNAPAAQIVDNVIRGNRTMTTGDGGGLYLANNLRLALSRNVIYQNTAPSGGGVFLGGNDASMLADNQIYSNTAERGGGLYLYFNPTIVLTNNQIHDNSASDDAGGLYMTNSPTSTLIGNQLYQNTANYYGGGEIYGSPTLLLVRNRIYRNIATVNVGGLSLSDSDDALFINTVIMDNQLTNSAGEGAGLRLSHSSAQLVHTTVARNAGGDGTGIRLNYSGYDPKSITLTNTILVNQAVGLYASGGNTATVNGVLWNDNLADVNGTGTVTVTGAITGFPAFAADGYHLMVCSSAINTGVAAGVLTDIDGDVRPTAGAYDLGADEYTGGGTCRHVYLPSMRK